MKTSEELKHLLEENQFKVEVLRSAIFYNEEVQVKAYYSHQELKALIDYCSPLYDMHGVRDFSIFTEIDEVDEKKDLHDMLEFRFVDYDNKRIYKTDDGDVELLNIMLILCHANYKQQVIYNNTELELHRFFNSKSDKYHTFFAKYQNRMVLLSRHEGAEWNYIKGDKEIPTTLRIALEIDFQYWKHTNTLETINRSLEVVKGVLGDKGVAISTDAIIKYLETINEQ